MGVRALLPMHNPGSTLIYFPQHRSAEPNCSDGITFSLRKKGFSVAAIWVHHTHPPLRVADGTTFQVPSTFKTRLFNDF
jgi:hypothetical protein